MVKQQVKEKEKKNKTSLFFFSILLHLLPSLAKKKKVKSFILFDIGFLSLLTDTENSSTNNTQHSHSFFACSFISRDPHPYLSFFSSLSLSFSFSLSFSHVFSFRTSQFSFFHAQHHHHPLLTLNPGERRGCFFLSSSSSFFIPSFNFEPTLLLKNDVAYHRRGCLRRSLPPLAQLQQRHRQH